METRVRILQALALLANIAIVPMVYLSIRSNFVSSMGNMTLSGTKCFRYFTNLSNIFAMLASLCMIPFNIRALIAGQSLTPTWMLFFKYMSTVSVTVTMATVLVFLGPTQGYKLMFSGCALYLHAVVPLLAIIAFCALEPGAPLSLGASLTGMIPTLLYGIVYLIMVVCLKHWPDFYGFTFGGKMWVIPIVMLAMNAATFALGLGLLKLREALGGVVL